MINRKQFQKQKEKDFFFAWLVFRRLSGPIALLLRNSFITPNQITIFSVITGLIAFIFLFKGDPINDLIGIAFFQFSFLLDCIDGDLARLKSKGRILLSGVYIDYLRMLILEPLLPIILAFGLYIQGYPISLLIIMICISFWRWIPQFTREHILIRFFDKNPSSIDELLNSTLLEDSPKLNIADSNSLIKTAYRLVTMIWGLPNGMINTITIIAIAGVFLFPANLYYQIKFYYLLALAIFYGILFIKNSLYEYKSLDGILRKTDNL